MNARTEPDSLFDAAMDAQVAQLRIPPHSIEAESGVLGGLLLDNGAWDRVGDLLTDDDFYRYEHRLIYGVVATLINATKTADVITVYEQLQRLGKGEEVGGLAYLNALAQYVPSARAIRRHAEIVRENAILRKLVGAGDQIATSAFNTQGRAVAEILDEAQRLVITVTENSPASKDEWVSMEDLMVAELDRIQSAVDAEERDADYLATGIGVLDDMLDGGMRGGQLIIVGARPSTGKTALVDGFGIHAARNRGVAVARFSMEMQNREGAQRALAGAARIPLHALRQPKRMSDVHWGSIPEGIEKMRSLPIYSNERAGLNIMQLRAAARSLKRKHGVGLITVDYLQLMSGTDPRAPRTYQLEEASRGLKSLAKELNVPVVALVQVNRGVEKEHDQMPRMSDIKDCGAIEQDADVIVFLTRPWVHNPKLADEWKPYVRAHLAKQRGGRTGLFDMYCEGQFTKFFDWPESLPVPTSKVITKGGDL